MDELLEQFLIEGRDLAAEAEAALADLAGDSGDQAALDRAFRAFHTLKGSVAIFDMAPAERTLHAAEDRLAAARKGSDALDRVLVETLIACIDQAQRWIDEMEAGGALGTDAPARAEMLLHRLGAGVAAAPAPGNDAGPWLDALRAREAEALAAAEGPLTAFRYAPDPECFFRGDDPLATVAAVPELLRLQILPAGDWPALDDWDPFRCVVTLEGLSGASVGAVRTAFRLVPDQVELATIMPLEDEDRAQPGTIATTADRMLRVDATRVDAIASGVGALFVATNALSHTAARADAVDPALGAAIRASQAEIERVAADLHRTASSIRMVPLAPSLRRLPRMVREIAEGLGKRVGFTLAGQTIEVDKDIADGLFEPLLHLVRNALDHGIEAPEARAAIGKPAEGKLELAISREGEDVVVLLADDGAGIDPRRIRDVAVARGVLAREAADELTDVQAIRLIFAAGFSTAREVTGLSGRGVGMDAVKAAVERLRGRIDVESRPGKGTEFRLRLPLSAITTRLLVVRVGEDRYGVPLDQIVETAGIPADRIVPLGLGEACVLRDRTLPVLDLASLLGASSEAAPVARLIVTEADNAPVAVRVDAFGDRLDALVRERRGLLASVPGVAGTALLGDGGVLLVLNLPELVA
ncbi:chemotaxis protein CheA [Sphingomonas sp.]|uniref:chemotaxis protein CheA n=1 Tax=Sphingomonas sp. TaxID=28214 RepID=UPI001B0F71FF|nr:chemotaxis protein CheA [Sphingomonas sp.]MBO9711447.1 chemotaxis protein CheA [Sphingomonas sp.]